MANLVIRITGSNASTGWLKLPNNGYTRAKRLDSITWQIGNHSGVYSIEAIEEKKSSYNIFELEHPYRQGGHWKGDIKGSAPDYVEYRYNIYWKASQNGPVLKHDPIISIRPSGMQLTKIILLILTALFGIFTFRNWQQKNKRR